MMGATGQSKSIINQRISKCVINRKTVDVRNVIPPCR